MTLSASRVADELDRTARLLEQHGADTTRRVHDLALGSSGSGGPGQRNAISDPTGTAATSEPDRLAGLEQRWLEALTTLHWFARAGRAPVSWDWSEQFAEMAAGNARCMADFMRQSGVGGAIERLHGVSLEIDHIIYETIPTDREEAAEELREKHYAATSAECCQACESVTGPSTDPKIPSTRIVSGLCRPGCYDMEKRQEQRGQYIDRATFIDHTRAGVARGEIVRPASPLWRTAVPTIHEGDPAAEWGYSDA